MSDTYQEPSSPTAEPAASESSEAERRARQLAQLVESDRLRRRGLLRFYLALLLVPVALAAAGLALARNSASISDDALRNQVTPIVENKVDEQLRPVIEEKFGGKIDMVIEQRVGDKIQGASPAKVRELSEGVEQIKRDLSQVQTGVQEMQAGTQAVQELKSALPQLREQLDAQGNSVRAIQERVSQLPRNPGTGSELNLEINRLNERIGGLEKQLNQRLDNLTTQLNKSSDSIDNLKLTVQKLRDMGDQTVPGKERQQLLNRGKSARTNP